MQKGGKFMVTTHTLTTRDLFESHIIRKIFLEHVYTKINITESETVISFGSDKLADGITSPKSRGTLLVFDRVDKQRWDGVMDLTDLKETIHKICPDIPLTLSQDKRELLIETKLKVALPSNPTDVVHNKSKIIDYLYSHRRTILLVQYFPLDPKLSVEACILTDIGGNYTTTHCQTIGGDKVSVLDIESLDRSSFDVYYLVEGNDSIVYEITNKLL